MSMLSHLSPSAGSSRKGKRLGRGTGSGHGKTCGKGHKGQRSRSGPKIRPNFEGGQMPLNRRLPKRGFLNPFRKEIAVLNLDLLDRMAGDAGTVDVESLRRQGVIKNARDGVKILGRGELSRPLAVRAHFFSSSAKRKILAVGGTTEEIA